MDPKEFLRLLRRRWLTLFLCAALGAALGYASTLLQGDDDGPVVQHWAAADILVENQDEGVTGVDLHRVSVFATGGEVPTKVAADFGLEANDLISRLRTVSDFSEGTLTISAVGDSLEEARDLSQAVADELRARLNAEGEAEFQAELDAALALEAERVAAVAALDEQIDALLAVGALNLVDIQGDAGQGETPSVPSNVDENGLNRAQADELRSLGVQRDALLVRVAEAQDAVAELRRVGAAPAPLVPLEKVVPFRISPREYASRIARGEQGETNFSAGEVELADTSSPTVSERLENPAARGLLGALAGLILGTVLIAMHHRLDPRLRTREQFEDAFGLPVLANVPVFSRKERKDGVLHSRDNPRSSVSEAYRYLRSVLLFARGGMTNGNGNGFSSPVIADQEHHIDHGEGRDVRVVMVTSAGEGEGKTTTAVNLAVLLAESGYNTLLINCDFRLPSAHKAFDLPYNPGTITPTDIPNLRFIADVKRTENDTPGQVSERQRRLISRARELVDVVVLDTAPLLATNDAVDILPETDLAVLVAREGKTTEDAAAAARALLTDRIGVPVAGVVVTAVGSGAAGGYYERYRYGSYFNGEHPTLWSVAKSIFGGVRSGDDDELDQYDESDTDPLEPLTLDDGYRPLHAEEPVRAGSRFATALRRSAEPTFPFPAAQSPQPTPAADPVAPVPERAAAPDAGPRVNGTDHPTPPTFRPGTLPADVFDPTAGPAHAEVPLNGSDDAVDAGADDGADIDLRFEDWLTRRRASVDVDID